jgi:hypothetical protein
MPPCRGISLALFVRDNDEAKYYVNIGLTRPQFSVYSRGTPIYNLNLPQRAMATKNIDAEIARYLPYLNMRQKRVLLELIKIFAAANKELERQKAKT